VRGLDGLSQLTLQRYKEELTMFSRYVKKPVTEITTNDLRQYLSQIQSERSYAKTTINNKIMVLRTFFSFLVAEEVLLKDPSLKLKTQRIDRKALRESLTIEELEEIRDACSDIREKAMIEYLYSSGCRVSEVIKAKISDIDWSECCLTVTGKGDKTRKVFFSIRCKIYLRQYLNTRSGVSDSIFISERSPYQPLTKSGFERAIARIAQRTKITKPVTPHVFRHTFATSAYQRGMGLDMIQRLLGHNSISTTQIYADTNDRIVKSKYDQYVAG
jgi:integrase/recombinase XerD